MHALSDSEAAPPAPARLRRLETPPVPEPRAPLAAWTLFFGALCASAGHGLFLLVALTRLRALPSRTELGGLLQTSVLAWFVACLPLVLVAFLARGRFLALAPRTAGKLAAATTLLTALAFVLYLRAVAL